MSMENSDLLFPFLMKKELFIRLEKGFCVLFRQNKLSLHHLIFSASLSSFLRSYHFLKRKRKSGGSIIAREKQVKYSARAECEIISLRKL